VTFRAALIRKERAKARIIEGWGRTLTRNRRQSSPLDKNSPMTRAAFAFSLALIMMGTNFSARAEEQQNFSKEQIAAGAELYAVNCSPCHGARMQDPGAAFNLRKFPPDQRERIVTSVTRGKNQMPPWGDFFKPDQLDALWAYITAGER
jgi:mono/diheme cytochrome c family protein